MGQAQLRLPDRDVSLFFHQIRPLVGNPSVTAIYDTISLRVGRNRRAKWLYLKTTATMSRSIITASQFTKACIVRDLSVPEEKVLVVTIPWDEQFVARVRSQRNDASIEPTVLYVGRFAAHKNLGRLVAAFAQTKFCKEGGRLKLVGGSPEEVQTLTRHTQDMPRVEVSGACAQTELESLYARSMAVVMPSLEEGFGLPAWEAMTCGIPVCISDGGSLPEATMGLVEPFPARSIPALVDSLDRAVSEVGTQIPARRAAEAVSRAPTLERFAAQIWDALAAAL